MTNDSKSKLNSTRTKNTDNKGVTVTSHDFDNSCSKKPGEPECTSNPCISVCNVREELQNVIDTMGPSTPLPAQIISSDADNESTYSASVYSSQLPAKDSATADESKNPFTSSQEQEDSQMTAYNVSDLIECPAVTTDAAVQTAVPQIYSQLNPEVNYQYMCPHLMNNHQIFASNMIHHTNGIIHTVRNTSVRASRFASWLGLRSKKEIYRECPRGCDLYKINIEHPTDEHSPPRRLVFDLMEEMPKADTKTVGTNTKNKSILHRKPPDIQNQTYVVDNGNVDYRSYNNDDNQFKKEGKNATERVDIYYFDHGNSEYYRTTDQTPLIKTEYLAERTEHYTKKFWAHFFGTIHIGVSFVTSFILQFVRFLLYAIIRPLTVGLVQLTSDYFIKPGLAVLFNGLVQPLMIFLYNFATSLRDVCAPLADSVGYFIREIAVVFKAIRLVQVDTCKTCKNTDQIPKRKSGFYS